MSDDGRKTKDLPPSNIYPLENIFGRILSPFERFLQRTTAGGAILIGATVITLIIAHSPWGEGFRHLWETTLYIGVSAWRLELTLHQWINEGLMTLFFLVVGLELKREILVGELVDLRHALLPVAGALGGMLAPAIIYHLFNPDGPASAGWGVPMATDIAFAVGIMVLLAWRIPRNLIIFLTALAIADDLGAVLIIALFFTKEIDVRLLALSAAILMALILLNRGGIRQTLPYAILGVLLWLALLRSGLHATVAGVLLAFTIPARPAFAPPKFQERLDELKKAFQAETVDPNFDNPLSNYRMSLVAENLEKAATDVQSPQQRLEHHLSPWVTFGVIPLFALANAGIDFTFIEIGEMILHPVTLGISLGLILGKFLGISAASWIIVKTGLAQLPDGVAWRHILGAAWLGGIGFTMSLFIAQLAFINAPNLVEDAKLGIFLASAASGVIGLAWLYFSAGRKEAHGP
jgi:NhaA family Na+:H+ antiporter